jgi:hypothetical protein
MATYRFFKDGIDYKLFFSRSGVEINFSDVNIVTEVGHSLGSFHFFWQLWQKSNGSFHFFWLLWQKSNCVVKATTNSIKFIERWQLICHHFFILKIWDFCAVSTPYREKNSIYTSGGMLIFPSVLCSPRASPSGYKLHLRKNHAFLSLNI